jgi:hypothetical protein
MELSRWTATLVTIGTAALLVAGCGRAIPDALDATTITARVKTAMLNDPVVGALRIDVDTAGSGVVTLSGAVSSDAERDQALALTRKVEGVSDVKDTIKVIPVVASPAPVSPALEPTPTAKVPVTVSDP